MLTFPEFLSCIIHIAVYIDRFNQNITVSAAGVNLETFQGLCKRCSISAQDSLLSAKIEGARIFSMLAADQIPKNITKLSKSN